MDEKISFHLPEKLRARMNAFIDAYEKKNDLTMSEAEFIRAAISEKLLREQNGGK